MSLTQRLRQGNQEDEELINIEPEKVTKAATQQVVTAKKDPFAELKEKLQKKVIEELTIDVREADGSDEALKYDIQKIVDDELDKQGVSFTRFDRDRIKQGIIDEIQDYGPISPLLKDGDVSEIMVNGPKSIYIEKKGKLVLSDAVFKDDSHVMNVIEKIVAPLGRRIDESSPMVDARLPNGSRVNAIIPPLALNGPTITIRKFSENPYTVADLIGFGTLSVQMAEFIKACIKGRLNIIVSGGTGSGKTTTLNVLSSFIPNDDRIVTIEDAAELQLWQEHVVRLETRPANLEGKGAITIRDLVKNSLRMRPDRIVVGEVRSGEALDMLQAMNTGHDGSLTTGHANSPRDMLSRLETMVLMAGMDLPVRAIREQISSAVDVIIQQSRLRDGSRKITHITEVQGMEGDVIVMQDIVRFKQRGLDEKGKLIGDFEFTGIRPKFIDKLADEGVRLPDF